MSNITGIVRASSVVKVGREVTGPYLDVNDDGSINVVVVSSTPGVIKSIFNEISGVAVSSTALINSYTVPVDMSATLQKIEIGGENIAIYDIYINSVKIARKRTYFGSNLSTDVTFLANNGGIVMVSGDILEVFVTNFRPTTAGFECRIQLVEN